MTQTHEHPLYYFDEQAAERPCLFIEKYCRHKQLNHLLMKTFDYLIKITFQGTQPTGDAEHRAFDGLCIELNADGDTAILNKDGLTGYGYKVLNMTLCNAISNLARNAAETKGFSEGEIIADAVKKLGKNIADIDMKPAHRVVARIKAR